MIDLKASLEKKKKKKKVPKIYLHGRYFENYVLKDRLNTDYHIHFECGDQITSKSLVNPSHSGTDSGKIGRQI